MDTGVQKVPRIPSYAKHMLLTSITFSFFGIFYQIRIWYKSKFQEVSWLTLIATLTGASIMALYQYYVYQITKNNLAFVASLITVCTCVIVIILKLYQEWTSAMGNKPL